MAKRQETLNIEAALQKDTRIKRIYGCEEITIGFSNNGHGNEIVDFMTMDSKGIIKCYEIKVTIEDFKSDAKKSWYGHYNYLVVGSDLWNKHREYILENTPKHIGIIGSSLESLRKCKKQDISQEQSEMLKESMIRSMYYKMLKYYNASDMEENQKRNRIIYKLRKEAETYRDRALKAENLIYSYEKYKAYNDRIEDFDFSEVVEIEKKKYLENRKVRRITTYEKENYDSDFNRYISN